MGMVMLGGAVDMPEAEIADTGEGGASGIFSIRTIGAFFCRIRLGRSCHVTGWVQHWGSYFCCDPIGFCISWSCHYLMSYLHSLRQEGTLNYSNAVGNVGNVYLPIPPKERGWGK